MGYALVGIGGALGAMMRFALSRALPAAAWPWGTFAANLLGGLAMGLLMARGPAEPWRLFLGVGVLGGFTTFSAFSLEAVRLLERAPQLALAYVGASVTLSIGACALGLWAAR